MVIIFSKTLQKKKGVNNVRSKNIERRLRELHTMSRGTTLFSCSTVEADRWMDLGRGCAIQRVPCQSGASLESLWDVMPEPGSRHWTKEPGSDKAITSLIRDLSLGNSGMTPTSTQTTSAATVTTHYTTTTTSQTPTAPPSKRQCRSLSFSDEFSGFRSSWRPQGSRVWTTVEKRRCHSGGSVRGGGGGHFPAMQRSSSFSLPSRSSIPSDGALDLTFFNQRLPEHPQFTASLVSPTSPSSRHNHQPRNHFLLRPLSLSHEHISLPELQTEETSETSSPDSTPDLSRRAGQGARRTGCLSRSRSQPCVLNDKKIGMKRRRQEDAQEQRPSLDLAKMTQKLQTFQSLSCPGFSAADSCQSILPPPSFDTAGPPDFTAVSELGLESRQEAREVDEEEDSSYEELDSDSACSMDSRPGSPAEIADGKRTLWKGDCGTQRDIFQLGGELDLDQIERN